ncbi:TIGR00269 family protein [Candidatus Woesearchaeota archaeon]|nr:TIGR00269 family protein [Candidatus Woesearchaeota archaeon]
MKCSICDSVAVAEFPSLCKSHFIEYVEKKVFETIEKYEMFPSNIPLVATSGGKDSLTTLYLVKKYFGKAKALLIDEGILGYREKTIEDLKYFCKTFDIKYDIVSFSKEFGQTLDTALSVLGEKPCSVCGVFRRNLLNKFSLGYGSIYLGHNLDDEAQAVIMNYLTNRLDLLSRLGPVTGITTDSLFSKRYKPLYFVTEKEVMLYTVLMGFRVGFIECPYANESFRAQVRTNLNLIESKKRGTKRKIIDSFLKILLELKQKVSAPAGYCKSCGDPSPNELCSKCLILERLNKKN